VQDLGGLNKYPYCGHSALMGNQKRAWQKTDYVISIFSNSPAMLPTFAVGLQIF